MLAIQKKIWQKQKSQTCLDIYNDGQLSSKYSMVVVSP